MILRRCVATAILSLAVSGPRLARADDDLAALLSEPVENTSGKSVGLAGSAPGLSISVSAEDLRRYGIRTMAEAYNFLTLGLDSEDPLSEPEVGARGLMFTGDQNKHILLLIDGHTTNDQESGASFHGHALGLPLDIVDHIEIVLGPGSVLYGANAMLGVVNVVTKRAKDYSGVHAVVTSAFSPPLNRAHSIVSPALTPQYAEDTGQEFRVGLGFGREFELRGRPAELTAQFEFYSLKGPTMTWGPQLNAHVDFGPRAPIGSWGGQTRDSYYARIPSAYARFIVGDFEATTHLVASRISQPYLKRNDQALSGDFDDPDGATVRRAAGLDLKWRHNLSIATSVQARIYGDWTSEDSRIDEHPLPRCLNLATSGAGPCAQTKSGYARSAGTELQWTFDWAGKRHASTLIGADGRVLRVGFQNGASELLSGQKFVFGQFDGTEGLGAIYVQQVYHPTRWLILNGGARWDVDSRFGSRLLPRIAAIAEPWKGGSLEVIYAEAFRAPTGDEVHYRDPATTLQSQGLRPETVRSIEAILEQRFGTQSLVFGVFRSQWREMIVRRELHDLPYQVLDQDRALVEAAKRAGLISSEVQIAYQYQNVASIESFGFNGGFEGTLGGARLAYAFNLSAAYARLSSPIGNQRVSVTPSMFGNARIAYDLKHRLPTIAVAAHFSDRRLSDAGETAGFTPVPFAPAALDLRGTLTGPFPRVRRLTYQLMGNYAFASSSPYTAGPSSLSGRFLPTPELAPTIRFTFMLGLKYDLESLR
jgi:outer membrane receptor for ferrienterochelin and colicins